MFCALFECAFVRALIYEYLYAGTGVFVCLHTWDVQVHMYTELD